jgi:replicative DNA helicase
MEYTKLPAGQRPENSDLSESVQMEYDLSAILHVYNEWKDKGGKTGDGLVMMYRDGTGDPTERPAPIVEVKVGKNKQTAFQDTLFYYFYPEWGKFKQCPKMEALERKHAREQKKFSGLGGRS